MCRLTAYCGPAIPLENVIVKPTHSLLLQSQNATESKLAVNGDGFGIAWYTEQARPGLYKDVFPAWSDSNLPDICRMVCSPMFLAHVRASTFGAVSRENCHPFTYDRWSFMHNGIIGNVSEIKRPLENLLDDQYYSARRGSTDSELFFLLMLTNGLDQNPSSALKKSIAQINALCQNTNLANHPIRLTCVFSNGISIYGIRYASDNKSPSLYLSENLDHGGRALASEPLHGDGALWQKIKQGELVQINLDGAKLQTL